MRMGEVVKPELAMSIELLLALQEDLEADWGGAEGLAEQNEIASMGVFLTVGFCLALCREEITKVVQHGLLEDFAVGGTNEHPHVVIPLLGRFKNEVREQYHLLPIWQR